MPLSSEEISAARKMHQFVSGYENRRRSAIGSLILSFTISLSSSFRLMTTPSIPGRHFTEVGYVFLGLTLGVCLAVTLVWLKSNTRYREACMFLKLLEREHHDELPWIKEEQAETEVKKHLAAVKELEQELANRHVTP